MNEIRTGIVVEFTAKGIGLPVRGTVIGFRKINNVTHVILNTGIGHLFVKPEDITVPLQD